MTRGALTHPGAGFDAASPGTIGGTTPGAASFTTLDFTTARAGTVYFHPALLGRAIFWYQATDVMIYQGGATGFVFRSDLNASLLDLDGSGNGKFYGTLTIGAGSAITNSGAGGALGALSFVTPGTGVATLLAGASSGTGGPAGTTSPTLTGVATDTLTASGNIRALSYKGPVGTTDVEVSSTYGIHCRINGSSSLHSIWMTQDGGVMIGNGNAWTPTYGHLSVDGNVYFGNSTSAYPMLKRSGTTLQGRLADDSAACPSSWSSVTVGTPAARAGGVLFNYFADGASVSVDGTEDTLKTDTLVANTFSANGDKVSGFYQIAIVGHAVSTDRIRLYAAGTAIFDTAALNFPLTSALTIAFEIIRVSSSVLRCACFATTNSATVIPYSQYTEITSLTLTNTQIVALKSISTGTNSAAADVTAKLGKIIWEPA